MNNDNGRAINILLCIAGVLCCIGSGFVTAPEGLLADESASIIQTMPAMQMIVFFALPCLLMVLACALVAAGKLDILSIVSVVAGCVLFAMMDFQFGVSHRAFSGILINMAGVILMAAGVALQVFATETGPAKVTRKAAKSRNPKEFRYERSHRPAYDDIYMDIAGTAGVHKAHLSAAAEDDEYSALDTLKALKEEEREIEAAQKEQEDEIEALLASFSSEDESRRAEEEQPDAEAKAEINTGTEKSAAKSVEEALADIDEELDEETEALLAEMEAESRQTAEELSISMPDVAASVTMAHMAEALETPNQTMTDFYEGIEDIFLDPEDQ